MSMRASRLLVVFVLLALIVALVGCGSNNNNSAVTTPATVTMTWATPAAIGYGTALSSTQLNASATVNGVAVAWYLCIYARGGHRAQHREPDTVGNLHSDRYHTLQFRNR